MYICQLLGIIVILCAYLWRDQPDHMSVMHFNSGPVVIKKATKATANNIAVQKDSRSQHHNKGSHKTKAPRHISADIAVAGKSPVLFRGDNIVIYNAPLRESYSFLYMDEINPPPPKA